MITFKDMLTEAQSDFRDETTITESLQESVKSLDSHFISVSKFLVKDLDKVNSDKMLVTTDGKWVVSDIVSGYLFADSSKFGKSGTTSEFYITASKQAVADGLKYVSEKIKSNDIGDIINYIRTETKDSEIITLALMKKDTDATAATKINPYSFKNIKAYQKSIDELSKKSVIKKEDFLKMLVTGQIVPTSESFKALKSVLSSERGQILVKVKDGKSYAIGVDYSHAYEFDLVPSKFKQ